jgi:hypothetical protein
MQSSHEWDDVLPLEAATYRELPLLTGEYGNLHIQINAYLFQKLGSGATSWMNKDYKWHITLILSLIFSIDLLRNTNCRMVHP